MKKRIKVKLGDLGRAVDEVEQYKAQLREKCRVFLGRLSELGVQTADVRFRNAQYDGTNDVETLAEWEGDNKVKVIARGRSVTFIEFGAGVYYSEAHPLADSKGAIRGEYGQGKGKHITWGYYGDPGTNGRVATDKDGHPIVRDEGPVILTHGNPPARAMYEASKAMREEIKKIAKEVFGS